MNKNISVISVQRGAALIAVLIILVIVTLLGVTAMRMGSCFRLPIWEPPKYAMPSIKMY